MPLDMARHAQPLFHERKDPMTHMNIMSPDLDKNKYSNRELVHNGRMTKIERYNWKVKDNPGVFMLLDKHSLNVDHSYQREENTSKVRGMANSWSWIACGIIVVANRDGSFWVIDGQHRVLASRHRADIATLPCLIFEIDSVPNEAKGFLAANTLRRSVTALDKYRAQLVAGDAMAMYINDMLTRYNVSLSRDSGKSLETRCVSILTKLARSDKQAFESTLDIVTALSINSNSEISEIILDGLFYLYRSGLNFREDKKLRNRILTIGDQELKRAAKRVAAAYAKGGARRWADGMLDAINHGLRQKYSVAGLGIENRLPS